MREIIAFVGRAGSGKDFQSNLLVDRGFKKVSFADPLREVIRNCLGMKKERFIQNYENYKNTYLFENQTLRNMLENTGSSLRIYDGQFFVRALINTIYKDNYRDENICISDLRYINEYTALAMKAVEEGDSFKCIFCDYHSPRYQAENNHSSAWLSNLLVKLKYKDLQEVKLEEIEEIRGLYGDYGNE